MARRTVVGITSAVTRVRIGENNQERLHVFVACDDGTAWLWAPVPPKDEAEYAVQQKRLMFNEPVPHTWIQYHTPIPGTAADEEYKREG